MVNGDCIRMIKRQLKNKKCPPSKIWRKVAYFYSDNIIESLSLSFDGRTFAFGDGSGNVKIVYHTDCNCDNWVIEGRLSGEDGFGKSVALSDDGTKLLVSSSYDSNSGKLSLYEEDSEGEWTVNTSFSLLGENPGDNFGKSITQPLSDYSYRFFVGAPNFDSNRGKVYYYDIDGHKNTEVLGGMNTPDDVSGQFGYSMDISYDGKLLAVSSPYYDVSDNIDAGKVEFYNVSGDSLIYNGKSLRGVEDNQLYGYSVSLSSYISTPVYEPGYEYNFGSNLQSVDIDGSGNLGIIGDPPKVSLYNVNVNNDNIIGTFSDPNTVNFGKLVALSEEGDTLVISSDYCIYIYRYR